VDIRNDALGSVPVWFLSKQSVLDVVSREYDVAIQSEEKFGVPVLQPGSPESPSAGHLNPHLLRLPRLRKQGLEQDRGSVAVTCRCGVDSDDAGGNARVHPVGRTHPAHAAAIAPSPGPLTCQLDMCVQTQE
jgi:hypothetical protein